jgi:hypothetical protein
VKIRRVHQEGRVAGIKTGRNMEPIDLEPKYSGRDISGKCIKCLAEEKLNTCLRELLGSEEDDPACQQKYEALVAFLRSPESEKLRMESERYLAEGKQVTVKIFYINGKPKYEIKIKE